MREIQVNEPPSKLPTFSFLTYGSTRSGKTHFLATLPRPLIIADVAESGYKTILSMDRANWFEPDVEPIIVGIDQMNDLAALAQPGGRVDQLIASGRIKSVVFDAFTFYCDFFLAHLFRLQAKADTRAAYGDLGKHLREVRVNYGGKGVNVGYGCLELSPDQDNPKGMPQIPGNQGGKFAAGVDFLWHAKLTQIRESGKIIGEVHEMHTRQDGAFIAGHRLGAKADLLPNPFVGNYTDFLVCLGYDVELLRKSLTPINAIKAVQVTATIAPKQPPVVVAKPATPPAQTRPVVPIQRPNVPAPKVVSPQASSNQASRGAIK